MKTSGVNTPETIFSYLSNIFNVKTSQQILCQAKKGFLYCLPLLESLLQKLSLLLKHVRRKLSCFSTKSSTRRFRSHCSWDREASGSSEAIARQFARRYLSAVSANFFEYQVLVKPWNIPDKL